MGKQSDLNAARQALLDSRAKLLEADAILERVRSIRAAALVSPVAAAGLDPQQLDKEAEDALIRRNSAAGLAQQAISTYAATLQAELTRVSSEASQEARVVSDQMDVLGDRLRAARQRNKSAAWSTVTVNQSLPVALNDPSGDVVKTLLAVNVPN